MRELEPRPDGAVVAAIVRGVRWNQGYGAPPGTTSAGVPLVSFRTKGRGGNPDELSTRLVGVLLCESRSDYAAGAEARHWGPQLISIDELRARQRAADASLRLVFAERDDPSRLGSFRTYFIMCGMGDAFVVLGATGNTSFDAPFTFRTRGSGGAHSERIGGILLAHTAWDAESFVELDLSEHRLARARSELTDIVETPYVVIAAHYDSTS